MKVCIASLFNVNREGALTHRVASPSSAASLAAARRILRAEGVNCLSIQRVSTGPVVMCVLPGWQASKLVSRNTQVPTVNKQNVNVSQAQFFSRHPRTPDRPDEKVCPVRG